MRNPIQQLFDAAVEGNLSLLKEAIGRGADVNFKNWMGYTALNYAKMYKHKAIQDVLKAAGAKEDLPSMLYARRMAA